MASNAKDAMDARSKYFLVFSFLFLTACSQPKTATSVFSESIPGNKYCEDMGVKYIENKFIVIWEDGRISFEQAENQDVFIENFVKPNLEKIAHVEFDKTMKFLNMDAETQSDVQAFAADDYWGQFKIQADLAWAQNLQGAGVVVGIVDSAVDYNHPQLKPSILVNLAEKNGNPGVDDDGNGYVDDISGWDFVDNKPAPDLPADPSRNHGSHVAGIVAADHNTGVVKGVAPKSKIIPASFLSNSGSGDLSAGINALNYVVSRGAKIINASWGGDCVTRSMEQALINIANQGVLLVVAAGNGDLNGNGYDLAEGTEFHPTIYPAALNIPTQITVSATTPTDGFTSFSNYNLNLAHIAAPGYGILSTVTGTQSGLQNLKMSGTSMASPMVAGAAAVLLGLRPQATAAQLKTALMNSVDKKSLLVAARGRLNLAKAVEEIKKILP